MFTVSKEFLAVAKKASDVNIRSTDGWISFDFTLKAKIAGIDAEVRKHYEYRAEKHFSSDTFECYISYLEGRGNWQILMSTLRVDDVVSIYYQLNGNQYTDIAHVEWQGEKYDKLFCELITINISRKDKQLVSGYVLQQHTVPHNSARYNWRNLS